MTADVYYDHDYNTAYCLSCAAELKRLLPTLDLERMTFVDLCCKWFNEKPQQLCCGHCEKNLSEIPN